MFSSLFNLDSDWVLFVLKDMGLQQKVVKTAADQIRPVYGGYGACKEALDQNQGKGCAGGGCSQTSVVQRGRQCIKEVIKFFWALIKPLL